MCTNLPITILSNSYNNFIIQPLYMDVNHHLPLYSGAISQAPPFHFWSKHKKIEAIFVQLQRFLLIWKFDSPLINALIWKEYSIASNRSWIAIINHLESPCFNKIKKINNKKKQKNEEENIASHLYLLADHAILWPGTVEGQIARTVDVHTCWLLGTIGCLVLFIYIFVSSLFF